MHSLKQFLFTLITERQRNEDKYFTFTIFISILSIVNQHTSHTSISIFIRNVAVPNYTHGHVDVSLSKKKLKKLKCHFPQITKDLQKKRQMDLQTAQLMESGMEMWWLCLETFGHWGMLDSIFTSGKF